MLNRRYNHEASKTTHWHFWHSSLWHHNWKLTKRPHISKFSLWLFSKLRIQCMKLGFTCLHTPQNWGSSSLNQTCKTWVGKTWPQILKRIAQRILHHLELDAHSLLGTCNVPQTSSQMSYFSDTTKHICISFGDCCRLTILCFVLEMRTSRITLSLSAWWFQVDTKNRECKGTNMEYPAAFCFHLIIPKPLSFRTTMVKLISKRTAVSISCKNHQNAQ